MIIQIHKYAYLSFVKEFDITLLSKYDKPFASYAEHE
jgi:hypothetical protein